MKKIFVIFLFSTFISVAYAGRFSDIPLPQAVPDAGQGGGFVVAMQAQENLRRQSLENQMLQQQIAVMQQEHAAMEMQAYTVRRNQRNDFLDKDIAFVNAKISYSLEHNLVGQSTHWRSSKSRTTYTITPTNNIAYQGNRYCREYEIIVKSHSNQQQFSNFSCRQPGGRWKSIR